MCDVLSKLLWIRQAYYAHICLIMRSLSCILINVRWWWIKHLQKNGHHIILHFQEPSRMFENFNYALMLNEYINRSLNIVFHKACKFVYMIFTNFTYSWQCLYKYHTKSVQYFWDLILIRGVGGFNKFTWSTIQFEYLWKTCCIDLGTSSF